MHVRKATAYIQTVLHHGLLSEKIGDFSVNMICYISGPPLAHQRNAIQMGRWWPETVFIF